MSPTVRQLKILNAFEYIRRAKRELATSGDDSGPLRDILKTVELLTDCLLEDEGVCPQCRGAGSYPPPTRQICDLCNGDRFFSKSEGVT